MVQLGLLVAVALFPAPMLPHPCHFNPLCSCSFHHTKAPHISNTSLPLKDISCLGVPFSTIPDVEAPLLTHMDIVDAGLQLLQEGAIRNTNIESVRLMNNKLTNIEDAAFSSISNSLRSLDLSYNELTSLPAAALARAKSLDWLNLHGNQITKLSDSYNLPFRSTLGTFFLGENHLTSIPSDFFSSFKRLIWLNLDNNYIRELPEYSLAKTIHTLSVSNNQLRAFPVETIENLPGLTWLTMRGNYIETIPETPFSYNKRIDKLDLGENFLSGLPARMFNGSLVVNDLNLDYNYIDKLQEGVFASLSPRRVYLGMNRIAAIHDKAFQGVESTLELLDLERNRLSNISAAFSQLRGLRYLYLSNNNISEVADTAFHSFAESLQAVSLSGNKIAVFPQSALQPCSKLSHLNLGYNRIPEIKAQDFLGWARNLDTLILRNNRLSTLSAHTFKGCPKLRELSLSFNSLETMDDLAFKDVGTSLESLEISFGLRMKIFPESALKPLQKLLWLSLDNNKIEEISETSLYNLGELQYLNLEANKLRRIPVNLLHKNVHKNLRDVRLSYNRLSNVSQGQFANLEKLQTILLTGNSIQDIEAQAFRSLPNLVSLILSHNSLRTIQRHAFHSLPHLQKLELQHNLLQDFSLSVFHNSTIHPDSPMFLNLSHNAIRFLLPGEEAGPAPLIQLVDISHNFINKIPTHFLRVLGQSLRSLDLSHNQLTDVEDSSFQALPSLQILKIQHNRIASLGKNGLTSMSSLQILSLASNRLEGLQLAQFSGLTSLRILSLAQNRLRSLPRDTFQNTKLEHVDLSNNEFQVMPSSALAEVSDTLRTLNLSGNHIQHIDSTMLAATLKLMALSLANNRLTILPDNVFMGLGSLLSLDLSANPIRANFKELFHFTQRLKDLRLAGTRLESVPELHLPSLLSLDLTGNYLADLDCAALENLAQLRHLLLSHNKLTSLPSSCWRYVPRLKTLDVSRNPVRVLTKESFQGLFLLQSLHIHDLPDLKRFDADSLGSLTYLSSLHIQSFPEIEKFKFRLGSVISGLASLKSLTAKMMEKSGVLTDQILGAYGPKLKEIVITGENLHTLTLDAFDGVENNYELLLAIRNTNIRSLPMGFHKIFANIAHFSLDLRENRFESLDPVTLYSNQTPWELTGTKIMQGGLALQGNPWQCSCENVWLGVWLRRWMREALQLHTSVVERGQTVRSVVNTITCRSGDSEMPLTELDEETPCLAAVISSSSAAVASQLLLSTLLLLHALLLLTQKSLL